LTMQAVGFREPKSRDLSGRIAARLNKRAKEAVVPDGRHHRVLGGRAFFELSETP
jgi:hypothetical protein